MVNSCSASHVGYPSIQFTIVLKLMLVKLALHYKYSKLLEFQVVMNASANSSLVEANLG